MEKGRNFRKTPILQRGPARISPKVVIWVVCEGKTEAAYIIDFANDHGNGRVRIESISEAGVPLTLANAAVILKKRLTAAAKDESADSFEKAFSVWIICDTDEHPHIPEAKKIALKNKIPFCISNPCFELWGLLHIKDQDAYIHRRDLQSDLKRVMPGYDHDKSAILNYDFIKDNYIIAKQRAVIINQRRTEEGNQHGNTSTTVYLLLDKIIENGKK